MVFDAKLLAFLSLLIVQVLVSIVYKFSQTKGTYLYSPLSVIASSEFIKLCISSALLLYSTPTDEMSTAHSFSNTIYSRLSVCYTLFQQEVSKTFTLYTFGLALLYVINNQLAFVLFLHVDIASISMFKSFSSFVSAILLWSFFQRNISREQWCSIILQVIGLCIVQYDACQNVPFLPFKYNVILLGSTLITAVCSVWNERLIKTHSVNIHIQNAVLYSFGLMLNSTLFFFLPNLFGQNDSKKHFFEGYSPTVYAIILCNSILGIVITFVYKYADAIVKTFSTACATGVLLYINVVVFKFKTNLTVFLGAIVIFVSSYLFLLVKPTETASPVSPDPDVDASRNETHEPKWTQRLGWKCHFVSFVCGSLVFYSMTYLFQNGTFLHSINNFSSKYMTSFMPKIVSAEAIYFNGPIVIHGTGLCTNNTLNATRVLINSNVCYPIEVCSNTVLSCYLKKTVNNQSHSDTVHISFTTSLQKFSVPITVNTTVPYINSFSHWEKNDVVLVVHFNAPHYERISFLNIYRDIFPLVLFTGPGSHPDVIECPEGERGFRAYECLTRAVLQHPNHNGYLMAHFDLLPIFYNLENKNLTYCWIPSVNCVPRSEANGWYWWNQDAGFKAITRLFNEMDVNVQNTTSYQWHAANYRKHAGENLCHSYSDIFYLPQRFVPDWLILTKLFIKHEVFLEIALPTITYMIISGNLSVNLETLLGENYSVVSALEFLRTHPSIQYIHRIEHTSPSQQHVIETVVLKSLPKRRNQEQNSTKVTVV